MNQPELFDTVPLPRWQQPKRCADCREVFEARHIFRLASDGLERCAACLSTVLFQRSVISDLVALMLFQRRAA